MENSNIFFSATTLESDNMMVAQVMNQEYGKIVRTIAQQFTNNPNDQQDLMQEGYIGLIEAAKRYDPSTGVQFESYACWWVRKYMREWMLNNSQIVRLSCKTEDYYKPLTEDIETPLYEEDGDLICYADILTDGTTIETDLIRQEEHAELHARLKRMIEQLPPLDQRVICALYGFEEDSVDEPTLAQRLRRSDKWIHRVHVRALKQLRTLAPTYLPNLRNV